MRKLTSALSFIVLTLTAGSAAANICASAASDIDGDGYGWENGASCQVTAASSEKPSIINGETGELIDFTRVEWNREDLAGKSFSECQPYYWNEIIGDITDAQGNVTGQYDYSRWQYGAGGDDACYSDEVTFNHDGTNEFIGGCWYNSGPGNTDPTPNVGSWSIENGFLLSSQTWFSLPWLDGLEYVEILPNDGGMVVYQSADGVTASYKHVCQDVFPTGHLNNDDPITNNVNECVDPDGDGWGWNGTASCVVGETSSTTSNGAAECVDADGDGWGWDGTASCVVGETSSTTSNGSAECVDSDGDGWGWDGTASCIPGQ